MDTPDAPITLFISDLHLTPERREQAALFQRFLREIAHHAQALYILGDFFEAWVGDDDLEMEFHRTLAKELHACSQGGLKLYFMPGNRDFLAGPALAAATGWTALDDPQVIDLYGTPTLISHGDIYCTDDTAYQAFRQQARDPAWQHSFLAQPIDTRRALARTMRERSELAKAGTKPDLMDVNPEAIRTALRQAGVTRMIHGHTHRPACHRIPQGQQDATRWVLPDWYERGGYLACNPDTCRLISYP